MMDNKKNEEEELLITYTSCYSLIEELNNAYELDEKAAAHKLFGFLYNAIEQDKKNIFSQLFAWGKDKSEQEKREISYYSRRFWEVFVFNARWLFEYCIQEEKIEWIRLMCQGGVIPVSKDFYSSNSKVFDVLVNSASLKNLSVVDIITFGVNKYNKIDKLLKSGRQVNLIEENHRSFIFTPLTTSLGDIGSNIEWKQGTSEYVKIVNSLLQYNESQSKEKGKGDYIGINTIASDTFSDKGSPLHMAVRQKLVECVEILLKAGANPNLKYKGNTPLEFAKECKQELQELLNKAEKKGTKAWQNQLKISIKANEDIIEILQKLEKNRSDSVSSASEVPDVEMKV